MSRIGPNTVHPAIPKAKPFFPPVRPPPPPAVADADIDKAAMGPPPPPSVCSEDEESDVELEPKPAAAVVVAPSKPPACIPRTPFPVPKAVPGCAPAPTHASAPSDASESESGDSKKSGFGRGRRTVRFVPHTPHRLHRQGHHSGEMDSQQPRRTSALSGYTHPTWFAQQPTSTAEATRRLALWNKYQDSVKAFESTLPDPGQRTFTNLSSLIDHIPAHTHSGLSSGLSHLVSRLMFPACIGDISPNDQSTLFALQQLHEYTDQRYRSARFRSHEQSQSALHYSDEFRNSLRAWEGTQGGSSRLWKSIMRESTNGSKPSSSGQRDSSSWGARFRNSLTRVKRRREQKHTLSGLRGAYEHQKS